MSQPVQTYHLSRAMVGGRAQSLVLDPPLYQAPASWTARLQLTIDPLDWDYALHLSLNGGANLDAPGLAGNVGIWARITRDGATLAEDSGFSIKANTITFRASCTTIEAVHARTPVRIEATLEPYGTEAAGYLSDYQARLTMALHPAQPVEAVKQ